MKKLPLVERMVTWQGEGRHSGRLCMFIRTYGCPLACGFCDSAQTWHPEWKPSQTVREMGIEVRQIAEEAASASVPFVVITGGEPAIHDLDSLIYELHQRNIAAHIETSGTYPLHNELDWITVSPKWDTERLGRWSLVLLNLEKANEWKLIIENENSIRDWWERISSVHRGQPVYLHPEWSQRDNPKVLESISEWIKQHPFVDFRAGYQLHKLYKVDYLDPNSEKRLIPLGGNPDNGY